MSEPLEPGVSPAAPSQPRTPLEVILSSVKDLLPAAALAAAVPMLVLGAMPAGNEKVMLTVIGALAGFLTGRATKGSAQ